MNGEKRNAYRILVGNQEGKRPLGRQRCRWVDNIKMDLRQDGGGMDWKDFEGSGCGLILSTNMHSSVGTEENNERPSVCTVCIDVQHATNQKHYCPSYLAVIHGY
jgi:hypothetical protein